MAAEVPVAGVHRCLSPQVAALPWAASGVDGGHLAEEQQPAVADPRGADMRPGCPPAVAEAVGGTAGRVSTDRVRAESPGGGQLPRRGDLRVSGVLLGRVPLHPLGLAELIVGEEARLPVADAHPQVVADVAVVAEEEQPDAALLGVPVDAYLVPQRLARLGRAAVVGQLAAEQPVHPVGAECAGRRRAS